MIAEERQDTVRAKKPVRFRYPDLGVTPYRRAILADGEVERLVRIRDSLGIAMQKRKGNPVLRRKAPGRLQLAAGVVDANDFRATDAPSTH